MKQTLDGLHRKTHQVSWVLNGIQLTSWHTSQANSKSYGSRVPTNLSSSARSLMNFILCSISVVAFNRMSRCAMSLHIMPCWASATKKLHTKRNKMVTSPAMKDLLTCTYVINQIIISLLLSKGLCSFFSFCWQTAAYKYLCAIFLC